MIRFRIADIKEVFENEKLVLYEKRDFYRLLEGDALADEKFPPFRDAESMRLIREIDKAELVENDWYSMVTPYGRTCMSALSGGTKYGLAHGYSDCYGVGKKRASDVFHPIAKRNVKIYLLAGTR